MVKKPPTLSINSLGLLADPSNFTDSLDITDCDPKQLIEQLKMMLTIRYVEEKIGDMVKSGNIVCPCHLGIGQEAVAVGVSQYLKKSDRVFGAHRSHAHYLALRGDIYALFAEVLGRATGCSKGLGGSMHLYDAANGFMGSVPIVSGTLPIAIGAALAAKMEDQGNVAVCYFGDGAAEEGALHECLNFASTYRLPILFVCENNFFSSHMHIGLRQPNNSIARFGTAHSIDSEVVDGNDVVKLTNLSRQFIERARQENVPGFIEAVTYRWRGHVGPSEDIDVGVKRNTDLALWKMRDPIRRLYLALERARLLSSTGLEEIKQGLLLNISKEWKRAEEAPFPTQDQLFDLVYPSGKINHAINA